MLTMAINDAVTSRFQVSWQSLGRKKECQQLSYITITYHVRLANFNTSKNSGQSTGPVIPKLYPGNKSRNTILFVQIKYLGLLSHTVNKSGTVVIPLKQEDVFFSLVTIFNSGTNGMTLETPEKKETY